MVHVFLENLEKMAHVAERRGSQVESVMQLEGKRKRAEEEAKETRDKRGRGEEL